MAIKRKTVKVVEEREREGKKKEKGKREDRGDHGLNICTLLSLKKKKRQI
jgi:hypothetical protein